MRRLLLVFTAFVAIGPFFQPGSAYALGIGPIQLPDFDPPASVDEQPGTRIKPSWLPANLGENATVVMTPGTGDFDGDDQLKRTRDIGFYDSTDPEDPVYYNPTIIIIGADEPYDNYPAAFGFTVLGVPVNLVGQGTINESVDLGTADAVKAATDAYQANPNQTIILNGYSQSGPVSMNAAYLIHRDGLIPDDKVIVVIGADSRFPNTGVENVVPSFLPGIYTNGDRDPADTGDIQVISYCVRGDATCGVGNPIAHPVSTLFYLLPGFYVHGFLNDDINDYDQAAEWTVGNTTYVVLDGGNPWGMMLRDLGVACADRVRHRTEHAGTGAHARGAGHRCGSAHPDPARTAGADLSATRLEDSGHRSRRRGQARRSVDRPVHSGRTESHRVADRDD